MRAQCIGVTMSGMAAKFKITKDKRGEYRFKLNAPNGETIAVSEGYKTKSGAKKGVDRVKKYAGTAAVDDESGD